MKQLLIEIDAETAERLERVAPSRSRKRSAFIRAAILRALDEVVEREMAEAYRRPVLLLTRTPAYAYLSRVMVVEVTSRIRGIPVEVPLSAKEGLRRRSVANLDNVHVIPRQCLAERIGALSPARSRDVKRALGYALAWDELK